jgi:hypothetical protein
MTIEQDRQKLRETFGDVWPDTSAMRRRMGQLWQQLDPNMQEFFSDWEQRLGRDEEWFVNATLGRIGLALERQQERRQQKQLQNEKMSARIRALRAKANDPSVTKAEAAAFAAKADELAGRNR